MCAPHPPHAPGRRLIVCALLLGACAQRRADPPATQGTAAAIDASPSDADADESPFGYAGHDARGIPHYATRPFTAEERALLREVFGVEDPGRLYISDSTDEGILKYDTRAKRCRTCYVDSYRIGFVSVRRPGESWEEVERRVREMTARDFGPASHVGSTSTAALDPDVREVAEQMLGDARRAGFHLRVVATYRSSEREAYLMALGHGRTHTVTSLHSYGRALDVAVDDGNLRHRRTRRDWVAFRRWVTRYRGGAFRVLGMPDRTWDWPHVELPSPDIGFRTIDAAIARARSCTRTGGGAEPMPEPCDFAPYLPSDTR